MLKSMSVKGLVMSRQVDLQKIRDFFTSLYKITTL